MHPRLCLLLFCPALLLTSCGDLACPDTESFFVQEASKEWLIDTDKYESFVLVDTQGSTESFELVSEWEAMNSSGTSTGFLGLGGRECSQYETIHQDFVSRKDTRFSLILEGAEPPGGQILEARIADAQFTFDLLQNKLLRISTDLGYRPDFEVINGDLVDRPVKSFVQFHSIMQVLDVTYYQVLEFVLEDFRDEWTDTTVVSVSLVRGVGLVQYKLHGGLVFNRVEE